MPGEVTSEQLPQLIEEANEAIMAFDAYLRKILIELKSAPSTPAFQRIRDIAEKKLHLTEQWKIIYGNEDAWPRQKVYVAKAILGYLRQPNFEFTDAISDISSQMSRGEAEAKQQTLVAATQVAMALPELFIHMSGAEPMFKLVFGLDMHGKELSGWERLEAVGDLALMAAMIYVPAKITSDLTAPKTTKRRIGKRAGKAKAGAGAGRTSEAAGEKTEIDPLGQAAAKARTEVKEGPLPAGEQKASSLAEYVDEIEVRIAEAKSRGVDVDEAARKHGLDTSKPLEDQISRLSGMKQKITTDALAEDLMKATQVKITQDVRQGKLLVVEDREPDTELIHQALIRQQAAERDPAEATLPDYRRIAARVKERMEDPAFREKLDKAVLRDVDVGETSYRPLLDDAGRSMLQRMAVGQRPIHTPAATTEGTTRTTLPLIPTYDLPRTQTEQKASLAAERRTAEETRAQIEEAKRELAETVAKLKESEEQRYQGQGAPTAEQTERELFQTGQRIKSFLEKKEAELGETTKRISEIEQAPVEVEVETTVPQPVLPPGEVFTPGPTGSSDGGYDKDGFNRNGFDRDGYQRDGNNILGWNRDRTNKETGAKYDRLGLDWQGYGKDGYDQQGWNRQGLNKHTGTKYDKRGYDRSGLDADGRREGQFDYDDSGSPQEQDYDETPPEPSEKTTETTTEQVFPKATRRGLPLPAGSWAGPCCWRW